MKKSSKVHLPFFSKTKAYKIFINKFSSLHPDQCPVQVMSYILTVRKYSGQEIKEQNVLSFYLCSTCEQLSSTLAECMRAWRGTRNVPERKCLPFDMITLEQRAYQRNKETAMQFPSTYCSIITDRADQFVFGLPHFAPQPKTSVAVRSRLD